MHNPSIKNKLQAILLEDCNGLIKADKYGDFPTITETSSFTKFKRFATNKKVKVFKRNTLHVWIRFILVFLFFGFCFYLNSNNNNNAYLYFVIIYVFALAYLGFFLQFYFYDENFNFIIYVDVEGIQINDSQLFLWNEIAATAIITQNSSCFKLVVLLHNEIYFKYNLLNFSSKSGIDVSLSNCIEFYKNKYFEEIL